MIEIYLLEQLLAFHKYGTLSAAAEHLHLAQPSLSRSMQKLEQEFNVPLFDRQKNRIVLNQTGILAARYAEKILDSEVEMERHVRAFDRSLRTLNIGSCAPGPLMELLPLATGIYSGMTISSAVDTEENLVQGLKSSEYGVIVLPHSVGDADLFCQKYMAEQLYVSIPPFHPAAAYQTIAFSEMDGQNFIMYAHVGSWEDIVRTKMPHSKFFLQPDMEALGELARYSDLPSFTTDITLKRMETRQNGRVNIPFSDPESFAEFYLVCTLDNQPKWKRLFQSL